MLSDTTLYEKLQALAVDTPGAELKFSERLARENGWSRRFAKEAVAEYKKFVYLAAISQTPVTPSDIIDQVWHLHLTYTRSYWDEMCAAILGKPLHHGPTQGGVQEDARYRDLYVATLAAYVREFEVDPPRAFWPPADDRFSGQQRWVDVCKNLVLPYRAIARVAAIATAAIGLSYASAALAAGKAGAATRLLPVVLVGVAVLAVIGLAAAAGGKHRVRRDSGTGDGGSGVFVPGSNDGNHGQGHHGGNHGGGHDGGGGHGCSSGGCSGGGCSSGA